MMLYAQSGKPNERAMTVADVEVHRCPFPTLRHGSRVVAVSTDLVSGLHAAYEVVPVVTASGFCCSRAHRDPPTQPWLCRVRPDHNHGAMTQTIRVALVNDYEIVLEGLRALLHPYDPEIRVVELDVKRDHGAPSTSRSSTRTARKTALAESRTRRGSNERCHHRVQLLRPRRRSARPLARRCTRIHLESGPRDPDRRWHPGSQPRRDGHADPTLAARAMAEELRWPGRDAGLTERESELLAMLPTGMTNRELAAHLYVSENTIKTQMRGLFAKLGVRNRVQAVTLAGGGLLGDHHRRAVTPDES